MKKLLFVIQSLENSGGSERSLVSRVNYLVEKFNYDITIVTTEFGSEKSFYDLNPKVRTKNIPISFGKEKFFDKISYIFFDNHKEEKPLLEFIHNEKFDICSSLGSETFLYQGNFEDKGDFIKVKENRFTYKKVFGDENISFIKKIWRYLRFLKAIKVQKKMDYVITLTSEEKEFWKKYLNKILVMPNFIRMDHLMDSCLTNKTIIAVGRLEKEKDFKSLISSFKVVVNSDASWKLEIYGEGSQKKILSELINYLDLNRHVFLKGAVKNIHEKYQYASIYVHTSIYEGFGNTILEAMSHSLPVVAFECVGGVKVLVKNNFNGFLIQNRNINEFAFKLIDLVQNENLRKDMGKNSKLIAENYSEEKIMLKWHEFYSQTLLK